MTGFRDELEDLETAEDFLRFFGIDFDQRTVHVNRLHILQRFHDYLAKEEELDDLPDEALRGCYKALIARAYGDFTRSDAIAEKVFKVHREQAERYAASFVPLDSLVRSLRRRSRQAIDPVALDFCRIGDNTAARRPTLDMPDRAAAGKFSRTSGLYQVREVGTDPAWNPASSEQGPAPRRTVGMPREGRGL
jgi:nitrogenase-stabilizing/protective protein